MRRSLFLAAFLILVAALAGPSGVLARPPVLALEVLKTQKGLTNSPTTDLYEFTLRVTNRGTAPVQFTNNSFVLEDSAGARHRLARAWYRQSLVLQPGESTTVDRLYFEIPKTTRPRALGLVRDRQVLGRVEL